MFRHETGTYVCATLCFAVYLFKINIKNLSYNVHSWELDNTPHKITRNGLYNDDYCIRDVGLCEQSSWTWAHEAAPPHGELWPVMEPNWRSPCALLGSHASGLRPSVYLGAPF